MDVALGIGLLERPADLGVVGTAAVLDRAVGDRRVRARQLVVAGRREDRGVGLQLEMALVLEPVADVDDQAHEQDCDRHPKRHEDEDASVLAPPGSLEQPPHVQVPMLSVAA